MKFNLNILRSHLFIQMGILPERVALEANFRTDLGMSEDQIKMMLSVVTLQTGVGFSKDSVFYLTDVFDLIIHMMLRSVDVEISEEYFNSLTEPIWQNFLRTKFEISPYMNAN